MRFTCERAVLGKLASNAHRFRYEAQREMRCQGVPCTHCPSISLRSIRVLLPSPPEINRRPFLYTCVPRIISDHRDTTLASTLLLAAWAPKLVTLFCVHTCTPRHMRGALSLSATDTADPIRPYFSHTIRSPPSCLPARHYICRPRATGEAHRVSGIWAVG